MEERAKLDELSLLGGPLHRLGCRLGLVRGETNTFALGLALGLIPWVVLVALAFIEDVSDPLFSVSVIGSHARLLVVIPLFFLCESLVVPRARTFVRTIVRAEVVPRHALPVLESEVARISRRKDSWLPDALCLLAAAVFSLLASQLHLAGTTAAFDPGRTAIAGTMTSQWYLIVCLTLFRFLLFRWIWQFFLWCFLLWRISRLELHLVPTHPDGAAGLGYLEVVHLHFTPLVVAISVIQAAMLAEEMSSGRAGFEAVYPAAALILLVDAVLFLGPLFIFAPKLWACRIRGLSDYMVFASRYVNDFDRKWLEADAPSRDLLGSQDLQSLADLGNSTSLVRTMRWAPVSMKLLKDIALAALLPILPLLLFQYPVAELAQKFFTRLTGL